jgi:hypothetical protein
MTRGPQQEDTRQWFAEDYAVLDGMAHAFAELMAAWISQSRAPDGVHWLLQRLDIHLDRALLRRGHSRAWVATQFGLTPRALARRRERAVQAPRGPGVPMPAETIETLTRYLLDQLSGTPAGVTLRALRDGWVAHWTVHHPEGRAPRAATVGEQARRVEHLLQHWLDIGVLEGSLTGRLVLAANHRRVWEDRLLHTLRFLIYLKPGITTQELAQNVRLDVPAVQRLMARLQEVDHSVLPALDDGTWKRQGPLRQQGSGRDWSGAWLDNFAAVCGTLARRVGTPQGPPSRNPPGALRSGMSTLRFDVLPERLQPREGLPSLWDIEGMVRDVIDQLVAARAILEVDMPAPPRPDPHELVVFVGQTVRRVHDDYDQTHDDDDHDERNHDQD